MRPEGRRRSGASRPGFGVCVDTFLLLEDRRGQHAFAAAQRSFAAGGTPASSRDVGIWMFARALLCRLEVNESLVKEPVHGSAPGSNITQGVPRRDQVGVMFIDLVLESSKGSPRLKGPGQTSADCAVADALNEIGHVLKPHVGRERIDRDEIEFVEFDWFSPSMPVSLVQNATCPVRGSIGHRSS